MLFRSHPVAFLSKSLNEHERNYEIYDKELLAMIRALEEYRHYLEGHPEPVEIWSDHLNLTYFRQAQKLTRRQARWSLFLSHFNFVLKHRPGKTVKIYIYEQSYNYNLGLQVPCSKSHHSSICHYVHRFAEVRRVPKFFLIPHKIF